MRHRSTSFRPALRTALIVAFLLGSFTQLAGPARADVCVEGYENSLYCSPADKTTSIAVDGSITIRNTELTGNTGVQLVPRNQQDIEDMAYTPDLGDLTDKEIEAAQLTQKIRQVRLNRTLMSNTNAGESCSTAYSMQCVHWLYSQPLTNQEWKNSCGASSVRLLVWQFINEQKASSTWPSNDPGEAKFREELGVKRDHSNASSESMPRVLNKYHTPTGDKFQRSEPASPDCYFGYAATAIWEKQHSIIQAVYVRFLPYWSSQDWLHFNITFGYDIEAEKLRLAEEYSSTALYGDAYTRQNFPKGDPHGTHWVSLDAVWRANQASSKAIVW